MTEAAREREGSDPGDGEQEKGDAEQEESELRTGRVAIVPVELVEIRPEEKGGRKFSEEQRGTTRLPLALSSLSRVEEGRGIGKKNPLLFHPPPTCDRVALPRLFSF